MTSINDSPALLQGTKFNKYQHKIANNINRLERKTNFNNFNSNFDSFANFNNYFIPIKEGYEPLPGIKVEPNGLTSESINLLNNINNSDNSNLQSQYNTALTQLNSVSKDLTTKSNDYISRTDPNNPYLNTIIRFPTSGAEFYVTNLGVAKYISSGEIAAQIDAPMTEVTIPWSDTYYNEGATIPLTPPLIVGTPVQLNQSLGNEGNNIFIDSIISTPNTSYLGCYADNTSSPLMTFAYGEGPPAPTAIVNGNFEQPQISDNSYQYITSTTSVNGWNFSAVLVNSSTAWGFPMPYPNGPQCACLQGGGQYIQQTISLTSGVSYSFTFNACNRPYYSSGSMYVYILATDGTNLATLYNETPPLTWTSYTTSSYTPSSTGNYILSLYGGGQIAVQGINFATGATETTSQSYMNYQQCQQYAVGTESSSGTSYQYFALQDVDSATGMGYCAVSNDLPTIESLGTAYVPKDMVILWGTNTQGQPGNTMALNSTGSMTVVNSNGTNVYSTPVTNVPPGYIGCYADSENANGRAFPNVAENNSGSPVYDITSCQAIAESAGATLFGLQWLQTNQEAQCFYGSNLTQAETFGLSTNCTQLSNGSWVGGGWTNAIYNTNSPSSTYILIVDNSGCNIYLGSNPQDLQQLIWTAPLNGEIGAANPAYAATEGIYGQNWIVSNNNNTLAAGDFIGSPSGSLALIMHPNGNLALVTFEMVQNCKAMSGSGGFFGGGYGANAIYDIGTVGYPSQVGTLGYIDENSVYHAYPSNNKTMTNTYSNMKNVGGVGVPISGALYNNTNEQACQNYCNSNSSCVGFELSDNNTCQLLSSIENTAVTESFTNIFNNPSQKSNKSNKSNKQNNLKEGLHTLIREQEPDELPIGVPNKLIQGTSIIYDTLYKGGTVGNAYGILPVISEQIGQINGLGRELQSIYKTVNNDTLSIKQKDEMIQKQLKKNVDGIEDYLHEFKETTTNIKNTLNNNTNNLLTTSDIVVLQKNYIYILWSILAIITILIAINITKK